MLDGVNKSQTFYDSKILEGYAEVQEHSYIALRQQKDLNQSEVDCDLWVSRALFAEHFMQHLLISHSMRYFNPAIYMPFTHDKIY